MLTVSLWVPAYFLRLAKFVLFVEHILIKRLMLWIWNVIFYYITTMWHAITEDWIQPVMFQHGKCPLEISFKVMPVFTVQHITYKHSMCWCLSVCLSVCLSQWWALSKQLNRSTSFLEYKLALSIATLCYKGIQFPQKGTFLVILP